MKWVYLPKQYHTPSFHHQSTPLVFKNLKEDAFAGDGFCSHAGALLFAMARSTPPLLDGVGLSRSPARNVRPQETAGGAASCPRRRAPIEWILPVIIGVPNASCRPLRECLTRKLSSRVLATPPQPPTRPNTAAKPQARGDAPALNSMTFQVVKWFSSPRRAIIRAEPARPPNNVHPLQRARVTTDLFYAPQFYLLTIPILQGYATPPLSFPRMRSTTQQPRTCSPPPRQWARISALSQPASSRASARIGRRSKARSV